MRGKGVGKSQFSGNHLSMIMVTFSEGAVWHNEQIRGLMGGNWQGGFPPCKGEMWRLI